MSRGILGLEQGIMLRLCRFLRQTEKAAPPEEKQPASGAAEATRAPTWGHQWRDCLEHLLASDGYVVQQSSEEMATGSSVRMWGSDLAFQITGEASDEDALRQWRVWVEISGDDEMEPPAPASAQWHYYKFGVRA
jgi:hypothetical protein